MLYNVGDTQFFAEVGKSTLKTFQERSKTDAILVWGLRCAIITWVHMGTFLVPYFNTVKTVGAWWSSVKEFIKILTYAIFVCHRR